LLNPDYRDILSAFSEENVEYQLVGAYALAVHGLVRATGDIDLKTSLTPRGWLETRNVIDSPHTADFEPNAGITSSP
jgi:hypothetical protein